MTNPVVFLEFIDEVEAFLTGPGSKPGVIDNTTIIALSLATQVYLKQKGIPFHTTLPYFNNNSHSRALTQSENWLKRLEHVLEPKQPLDEVFIYSIRFLFNYLLWLSEVAYQVIEKLKPKGCYISKSNFDVDGSQWSITTKDRFLGGLLTAYCHENLMESNSFHVANGSHDASALANHTPVTAQMVKNFSQRFFKKRKLAVITTLGYGMDAVVKKLTAACDESDSWTHISLDFEPPQSRFKQLKRLVGLRIKYASFSQGNVLPLPVWAFPYQQEKVAKSQAKIRQRIQKVAHLIENHWRSDFVFRGFDLVPAILSKLNTGILTHLESLALKEAKLQVTLETVSPKVVMSPFASGIYGVLGAQCRKLEIPAAIIPHGTLAPPNDELEEIEWQRLSTGQILSSYPFAAAQTPLAAKHASYYNTGERTLKTGPIIFARTDKERGDELRQKLAIPDDFSIVCYAAAQRKRSSVRFHIFETEDEYLSAMADLVNAINRIENTHLIIKLHPSSEFTDAQMRDYLPQCQRLSILHREPFADVLAASDLLVSYLSTTVEEALINHTPVVLYDKWNRFRFVKSFNCNGIAPDKWEADVAYYTSDSETLDKVVRHALNLRKNTNQFQLIQRYKFHTFEGKNFPPLLKQIQKVYSKKIPPKTIYSNT